LVNNCGPGANNDESNCGNAHMCDFEHSFCDWSQDRTDTFDWLRISGPTTTVNTGPDRDHTTGLSSGWYAYIEASLPRRPGDKARLLSPVIQVSDLFVMVWRSYDRIGFPGPYKQEILISIIIIVYVLMKRDAKCDPATEMRTSCEIRTHSCSWSQSLFQKSVHTLNTVHVPLK
jgi:hypothetical protein